MKKRFLAALGLGTIAATAGLVSAQVGEAGYNFKLNPDGSVNVAGFVLPHSAYASPEARTDMEQKFQRLYQMRKPEVMAGVAKAPNPVQAQRDLGDKMLFGPFLEAQKRRYAVTMTSGKMAGVEVQIFNPNNGVSAANKNRVLINLHGGAFMVGWPLVSQIESIPVASTGEIKVISVNYGMFPEAKFPRGSQDVAAVYKELLKTHKPSEIGIYGCSAGGILTSEAMAWFQKESLPSPAAIAILSANLDPSFLGDSAFTSPQFGSYIPAPDKKMQMPYFEGADLNDPLVSPSRSREVLAKFPPTLLATGTRASDMSASTRAHLDLLEAGVDAQLALWDGVDHCFMYNPDMPESREAYGVLAQFFQSRMDGVSK